VEVEINYVAVILAGASSMAVGALWYAPSVFGNVWMQLTGLSERKIKEGSGSKPITYLYVFIASLITAYVLAHITFLSQNFFHYDSYIMAALNTAFWMWLGFTAARMLTHDLFENRRKKLTLINIMHEFVTIMVMGLIIGILHA
jgi:uncharacterized protein DUF1761